MSGPFTGEEPPEPRLVEDRDAELLGLGELRTGVPAGDDVGTTRFLLVGPTSSPARTGTRA